MSYDCENSYLSMTGWDDSGRCPYCAPASLNARFDLPESDINCNNGNARLRAVTVHGIERVRVPVPGTFPVRMVLVSRTLPPRERRPSLRDYLNRCVYLLRRHKQ